MEEYPDSALSILEGIDRQYLKDSDLPYYALLYTQAQIKTDVRLTSDSLINIAYAKYGENTKSDRGVRSNFYTGEVYFNQDNYREAMGYYLNAYEVAKRLHDDYWHAKAAERISNIFFIVYNYEEAQRYIKESADLYKSVGRIRNNRFALGQLANIMVNQGQSDLAYNMLDSLKKLTLSQNPIDTVFLDYIKIPLIDATMQTNNVLADQLDEIDFFPNKRNNEEIIDAAILQSQIYNYMNNAEESNVFLSTIDSLALSDEDRVHMLYARYISAKASGNSVLALSLVDSMLYYQNVVTEDIIKESVTGAQRDFYSQKADHHEVRLHYLKWLLILAVIIFILLVSGATIYIYFKTKARKAESEAQLEAFLSLKSQYDQNAIENVSLRKVVREIESQKVAMSNQILDLKSAKLQSEIDHREIVEKLFKEKWTTLDTLCDQYYGLNNSELNAKDLVANIQKELKKVVSKEGLSDIVDAVDMYMGGIATDLRIQCKFLKDADINFITLLFAGFSVRAVCMFTGIKYPYFYVKKQRLRDRIAASDAPDKAHFLSKIK